MPAPTGAYVIRNALVKIGSTTYTNQVTKARLVPDTPVQTLRTLVPDGAVTDVDSTAWTLELSGVADWTNATGIADALNDAAGALITMTIAPKNLTGQMQAVVSCYAIPPEFGGEQGEWNLFELELPVVGFPVFSALP